MKNKTITQLSWVLLLGLSASLFLIFTLAWANPLPGTLSEVAGSDEELQNSTSPDLLFLRFPLGDWPWYAQGEIFLNPEPPMTGMPVEICAGVVNDDLVEPHLALLQFGVAPLGIGVNYVPVGRTQVLVPPGGYASGCTTWVSPDPGRWGIEVLLFEEGGQEPLRSLRNIVLSEPLFPGEPHELVFLIGPIDTQGTLTFALTNILPEWQISLEPSVIIINPFQVYTATLTTTPPQGIMLGSNMPIVDVEGFPG